ncbi:hypothetical protein RSAG8_02507, partial [Rhizoctonia solani AG-8 WAC10335]
MLREKTWEPYYSQAQNRRSGYKHYIKGIGLVLSGYFLARLDVHLPSVGTVRQLLNRKQNPRPVGMFNGIHAPALTTLELSVEALSFPLTTSIRALVLPRSLWESTKRIRLFDVGLFSSTPACGWPHRLDTTW